MSNLNDPMTRMWFTLLFQGTSMMLRDPEKYPKSDREKIALEFEKLADGMQASTLSSLMDAAVKDVPEQGQAN